MKKINVPQASAFLCCGGPEEIIDRPPGNAAKPDPDRSSGSTAGEVPRREDQTPAVAAQGRRRERVTAAVGPQPQTERAE